MARAESSKAANGLKASTDKTPTNYELPWVRTKDTTPPKTSHFNLETLTNLCLYP